jgi:hypothetical protein
MDRSSLVEMVPAWPVAGLALAALLLFAAVFPGALGRHPLKSPSEARFWAGLGARVAATGAFAQATGLYDLVRRHRIR